MATITLYHNPQCSKSRQALLLLQNSGLEIRVIYYLKTPLSLSELRDLSEKLNLPPRDFIRSTEAIYKTLNLDHESLTSDDLLDAISKYPRLMERPIAVCGTHAIIGRPPENVLAFLDKL